MIALRKLFKDALDERGHGVTSILLINSGDRCAAALARGLEVRLAMMADCLMQRLEAFVHALDALGDYLRETQLLGSIQSTLYWDQNTGMPSAGADWRCSPAGSPAACRQRLPFTRI